MAPGFLSAVFWRIVATLSSLATGLITLRLLGRHLSPSAYGVVLVALQVLGYLPFLDGGFRTTVNRGLLAEGDPGRRARLLRFGQTLYSALSLGVIGLSLVVMAGYGMTPLAAGAGEPLIFFLVIGLSAALTFASSAQAALLVGLHAQASLFLLNSISAWLSVGSLWLAFREGAGLWAFPISQLVMTMGTYPLALWLIWRREAGLRIFSLRLDAEFREVLRGMRADAWACFRSQVSIMLLFTMDVILVGALCGAKAAAAYGVLSRVFGIIRNLLQATGEAAWPIVAKRGTGGFARPLMRLNAWLYGAVMGAVAFSLIPFIEWYMGADWAAPRLVLYLAGARCLITGVSSSAAYYLIGLGRFQDVARYIERELACACIAAVPLGIWLGTSGVAGAFLGATLFGTLTPIVGAFARAEGVPARWLLMQTWSRALAGLGISLGAVLALLHWLPRGPFVLAAAAGAVTVVIAAAIVLAAARGRVSTGPGTVTLRDILNRL